MSAASEIEIRTDTPRRFAQDCARVARAQEARYARTVGNRALRPSERGHGVTANEWEHLAEILEEAFAR